MRSFEISAGALVAALATVSGVICRRGSIPILSHVLLSAENSTLSVSATDLDLQWDASADLLEPTKEPIAFTVSPFALLAALKGLPRDWPVTVGLRDNAATVAWKYGSMTLLTLPASDFPTLKIGEALAGFRVEDGAELTALARVAGFISTEETRYYLNGVYLDRNADGAVLLVATDGHRMAAIDTTWTQPEGQDPFWVIVPRKTCEQWRRGFRKAAHEVSHHGVHIRIASPGLTLTSKLIDRTFPEWRRAVPKTSDRGIKVSRLAMIEAAKAAAAWICAVGRRRSASIMVSVCDGQALISAKEDDQALSLNAGPCMGDRDFWLGVNARYLADLLAVVEGDEVWMSQVGEGDPVLIGGASAKFVVMPLRLDYMKPAKMDQAA